jgi:hypothetical protein
MQYETTWPIGLSERTAIHALTMLNGGGQIAPSGLLHETAWLNWHTGVRNILGHQLRITPLDTLPTTTQQPACLTFRENSPGKDPAPFESEPVFLAATPKTAVRLSISPSGPEPSHVFFETQRNGGGWAPAGPEGNSLAVPVGTRLCLAPNGSAATISYLGSSLPYMLELSWYPCGGDQKTCQDKPWQVTWRRMENRTPGDMSFPGLFNCVRALNVSAPSEKDLSRIDADFTDEPPEVCDSPGPTGDGRSKVGLFRASYVPGMMSATLNEGAKKPLNFIKCTGKKDSRECELPNTIGKLFVNRDNSSSDYWAMSVYPVVPDYPIKNVVIAASTIAQVAVDERRNLWITDGKGHFWMLINDRSAMEQELWRRSEPLLRSSDWYGRFPEIKMNMTPSDLQNRGPLPAPNTQPNN